MTPVEQIDGQCFAACMATVFGVTLSEVPLVNPDLEDEFWADWRKWLAHRNLDVVFMRTEDMLNIPTRGIVLVDYYNTPALDEDDCHVVVWLDGKQVHDPKRGPIREGWPTKLRGYYFLRVLHPEPPAQDAGSQEEEESDGTL